MNTLKKRLRRERRAELRAEQRERRRLIASPEKRTYKRKAG